MRVMHRAELLSYPHNSRSTRSNMVSITTKKIYEYGCQKKWEDYRKQRHIAYFIPTDSNIFLSYVWTCLLCLKAMMRLLHEGWKMFQCCLHTEKSFPMPLKSFFFVLFTTAENKWLTQQPQQVFSLMVIIESVVCGAVAHTEHTLGDI